ncbi:Alpha-L-arabinofuranosidase 1 [Hordeum vulgare]|nr:Alpha-L-arabinofuranosidase 1 [Hordeum vulgare]
MYLERLRNWDVPFRWGSAALSYLYRQLDQASMRTKDSSSLCGFVWSLSVWMWERLPVGLPMLKNPDHPNPNPHEGIHHEDPYRRPTVAYHWDQVSVYTGSSHVRYKCYVNEMDTLTDEQKFKSRFHKWAAMLSCHGAQSVDVFTSGTSRSSRARRH